MTEFAHNPDPEKRLLAFIDRRYQNQADKNLDDYLFANYLFQTVEPDLIAFVHQNREAVTAYLADTQRVQALVAYCIEATKRYTYQRNQFVNFRETYEDLLEAEYRTFFENLRQGVLATPDLAQLAKTYQTVLKMHHDRLRLIFSTYCAVHDQADLKENNLVRTVPCAEYSAAFQLKLLGLDRSSLQEPVLDIGCGSQATLVEFLRGEGYLVYGLDRLAPESGYCFQADWLDFDYVGQAWGTIIAHQSFSTHFIYNHLHTPALAAQYVRVYWSIIASLDQGGLFCYAPGLPFFEPELAGETEYKLGKTPIPVDDPLGIGEIFYVTKIQKCKAEEA